MASFDTHICHARCREKGAGSDPCVQGKDELATPTYKLHKERKSSGKTEAFINPSQVSVEGPVEFNQSVAFVASTPSNVSVVPVVSVASTPSNAVNYQN